MIEEFKPGDELICVDAAGLGTYLTEGARYHVIELRFGYVVVNERFQSGWYPWRFRKADEFFPPPMPLEESGSSLAPAFKVAK